MAESNSQVTVESLIARCNESLLLGKDGGLASLTAYRDAGVALLELKEVLPRGRFGHVATEGCGCSKQWRARLMQLAREWDDMCAALKWAESNGSNLVRKAYSVDGALALVRAWRTAQNGDALPKHARGTRQGRSRSMEREIANLKTKLSAGAMYIAVLEQELAARPGTPNEKRLGIDAADRSEVQKVATSWLRPATDSEVRQPRMNFAPCRAALVGRFAIFFMRARSKVQPTGLSRPPYDAKSDQDEIQSTKSTKVGTPA